MKADCASMSMISATGQVGNSQYLPGYIAIAITGEHRKHGDTAAASRGAMQSQADGIFKEVSTTGLQKNWWTVLERWNPSSRSHSVTIIQRLVTTEEAANVQFANILHVRLVCAGSGPAQAKNVCCQAAVTRATLRNSCTLRGGNKIKWCTKEFLLKGNAF